MQIKLTMKDSKVIILEKVVSIQNNISEKTMLVGYASGKEDLLNIAYATSIKIT